MNDVTLIKEILEAAGRIAMQPFMKVNPSFKANQTYVTEADLAVQAFLKQALDTHFPEDGIIAEENNLRHEPISGDRYWIIDPIDGTASFVAGLPVWGIGLGLMDGGKPVAGFFWIPMSQDFYHTTPEGAVYRNEQPTKIKTPAPLHRESLFLSFSRLHRRYTLSPHFPGKLRGLGSTIAHMCYVATGSADAALLGRVCIWDLAAGMALLVNNGGVLRYLHGPAVRLTDLFSGEPTHAPMLCGHPEAVARFEALITPQTPSATRNIR